MLNVLNPASSFLRYQALIEKFFVLINLKGPELTVIITYALLGASLL